MFMTEDIFMNSVYSKRILNVLSEVTLLVLNALS